MKLVIPKVNKVLDFENNTNTLIIENQNLFYEVLALMKSQLDGNEEDIVLSENNKRLDFSKNAEMIIDFVSFEGNSKTLSSRLTSFAERLALNDENYESTMKLVGEVEKYVGNLEYQMDGDITHGDISAGSILKMVGLVIDNEYAPFPMSLLNYMEAVNIYEKNKLFILVNLRDYLSDKDLSLFLESIEKHKIYLLMIEAHERIKLSVENRIIIDKDLCEIC